MYIIMDILYLYLRNDSMIPPIYVFTIFIIILYDYQVSTIDLEKICIFFTFASFYIECQALSSYLNIELCHDFHDSTTFVNFNTFVNYVIFVNSPNKYIFPHLIGPYYLCRQFIKFSFPEVNMIMSVL